MKNLALFIFLIIITSCNNSGNGSSSSTSLSESQTYEQKVMSVEETEKSNPSKFLKADGTYNENFWGDKFKLHGTVTNTATVAKFKDIVIEVIFYTKTDTELGRERYVLYEKVNPHQTINFEWKLDKPNGSIKKMGWNVVKATAE